MVKILPSKGQRFNLFKNLFCQQRKWIKKYIKHLNKISKLITIRKQLPQRKED
jgi:hypothetical protein